MKFSFFLGSLLTLGLSFSPAAFAAGITDGNCSDSQHQTVTTSHTATINGQNISYTATIGFLEVTSADQTARACVFYTSYAVQPAPGQATRPLTFAFNGGPGSASVWLHLGLLGPKRVDMGADGLTPAPSSSVLVNNDYSLLDTSDVVMIDPVATGFSSTENGAPNDPFFGVSNDYISIGEFVRNYLITYNRWNSPLFILGESYGGIRGPLLANYLQSAMQIQVAGLILISPALSEEVFFGTPDDVLPYITYFPSFATTAWFHQTIAAKYNMSTVDQVFAAAKQFSETRLQADLLAGGDLDPTERDAVAQVIADFTGLSKAEVLKQNLRVDDGEMFNNAVAGSFIGRYDSRFVQPATGNWTDPSSTIPGFAFAAGINQYLRQDLGFTDPIPYNIWGNVTSWPMGSDGMPDVMTTMAQSLAADPNFRVMILSGYYDLACPMDTVSYELRQLSAGMNVNGRVYHTLYPSGHMVYLNPAALAQAKSDISAFIQGSAPANGNGPF